MNQSDNQVQNITEQWLASWWQWVEPIHRVLQSPLFNAYLQDSQEAYQKALLYWQQKPEEFQAKIQSWANESHKLFSNHDLEELENTDLLESVLEAQKSVSNSLQNLISSTEELTEREASLLRFNLRQIMAFVDPRNSLCSNPDVLQRVLETEGQSLMAGGKQCQDDINNSRFGLDVKRAVLGTNKLGETFAATPGSIIFQNELMQLIHYEAQTEQQNSVPLLIIPPCINRFYVLDLLPENSLVNWLSEQGYDVYMISWVNPDRMLADTSFDDYLQSGCLAAMDVVSDFAQVEQMHLVGYCIGGLMASILASSAKGKSQTKSLTLLTTILDYNTPGELGIFVSPRIMDALRQEIAVDGILKSESMSLVFTLLREEQLLWNFVRKNYLLGETPSFDALMYWGQDGTNLPGKMALEYLDNFYLNNCLVTDHRYSFNDEAVSLKENGIPTYVLACEADHIAPASAVISGIELLGDDVRAIVASGGHVRGVVNHPSVNRGSFRVIKTEPMDNAGKAMQKSKGSWWYDWHQWLQGSSSDKVRARPQFDHRYPEMEAAPGSYAADNGG